MTYLYPPLRPYTTSRIRISHLQYVPHLQVSGPPYYANSNSSLIAEHCIMYLNLDELNEHGRREVVGPLQQETVCTAWARVQAGHLQ